MIETIDFDDRIRFAASVIAAEKDLISRTEVRPAFQRIAKSPRGIGAFAAAFYFVRVNFVKHNFILGSRLGQNERLWAPLVKNLSEELGGLDTVHPSHNELYRRFLAEFDLHEEALAPLPFAEAFDRSWTDFVQHEEADQALLALGVYELLDGPDYTFMRDELRKGAVVSTAGLDFFEAHAEVRHFEMFEGAFEDAFADNFNRNKLRRAVEFVFSTQANMWHGLAEHLASIELH